MGIWKRVTGEMEMAMKTEERREEKRSRPAGRPPDTFFFFFLLPGAANNPMRLYADPDWSIPAGMLKALRHQVFRQTEVITN